MVRIDDLTAFETRLRRSAAARATGPASEGEGSRELGDLLLHVAERRRRRGGSVAPVGPPAEGGTSNGDDRVDAPAPASTSRRSGPPGQVIDVEQIGPRLRILRVGRPHVLRYEAGQYVKVGLAGNRSGSFSLASAPHDPYLELCIELVPGGRLTPALFRLAPGDRVEVGDRAKGSLRLDRSASTHLLVGTLTGIAPLRSLVRDALHRGVPGELLVLHGASHADELPYAEELRQLAAAEARVTYVPTVSRPADPRNAAWRGATGRVDDLAVRSAAGLDPASTHVYTTGNAGMIANVRAALGGAGFRISTESFH